MGRSIGLSGGIGSGKSTVAGMLTELGSAVIDADAIVHELQARGQPLLARMVEAFGEEILFEDGSLDRKGLGSIVFRDEAKRRALGAIVHPAVGAEMARRLEAAHQSHAPLVVLDIPLLFEGMRDGTGSAARMGVETAVLVWVPVATQIERTMARDACDRGEAERRIASQMPIDDKRALADHIVDNSGALAATRTQVEALFALLVT